MMSGRGVSSAAVVCAARAARPGLSMLSGVACEVTMKNSGVHAISFRAERSDAGDGNVTGPSSSRAAAP
ncbi:hypothetical protein, partial [Rhodococcus ruber]